MKKEFTFNELISRKGCYSEEEVIEVFGEFKSITLIKILNSNIPLKDKAWFLYHSCDLISREKKNLSYLLVEAVVPIYNNAYPNDDRINNCMKGIKDFNDHLITKEELSKFRNAVYDAANIIIGSVICTVYHTAIATYSIACGAYCTASYAAVNAAAHSNDESYKDKLLQIMIDFVNN